MKSTHLPLKALLALTLLAVVLSVLLDAAQANGGFVEVNRFEAPDDRPCALTFDGTNLYMSTCNGRRTIFVLGTDGTLVKSFLAPSDTGAFDGRGNPDGLAFDGNHLFVADLSGTIFEIDTAGTEIFNTFSVPTPTRPSGMTFDGSHLFISDGDSSRIFVFTTDGTLISEFSAPDRPTGNPIRPAGLAFQAPNLFAIDIFTTEIYEFSTDGSLIQAFSGPRDPGVQGLGGITFAKQNMFIAEVSDPDPYNPPEIPGTIFEMSDGNTTPDIVPNAPTNLSAIATSSGSIDLTWQDNADNENSYILDRSEVSGTNGFTQVASLASDSMSYSDTGLSPNSTYYYRVAAVNSAGQSDYSNVDSATTQDAALTPPVEPSDLGVSNITSSSATLSWTDNSNNETGFQIGTCTGLVDTIGDGRYSCASGFNQISQVGANVTSYTFTGLSAGTQYTRFVRAYNAAGNSVNTGVRFTTIAEVAARQVTIINQINSGLNLQEVVQVKVIPRFGTFTRSDLLTDDPAQCLSLPGESINRLQSRTFDVDIGDNYEVFIGIGTWDLDNFFCSLGFNWFKRRFFTDPSFQTYYVWTHVIVTGHASDNWNWKISGSYLNGTLVVTLAGGSGIPFEVTIGNPIP